MAFSPGDIVQLKSGGTAMTVVAETPEGVHCIWHTSPAGDLKSGVIPRVCLDLLELDDDTFDLEALDDDEVELDLDDEPDAQKPRTRHGEH